MGLLVVFLLEYSLGLLAFWSGEITGWTFIKNVVANLSAGTAFPLEVLPAPLLAVAVHLPFRFLVHVPAHAYSGRLAGTTLAAALAEGLAWAGALALAALLGWRAGLRRFTAAGG